jgi:glutamine cyclotransferase
MRSRFLTVVIVAVAMAFSSVDSFAQTNEKDVTIIEVSQTDGQIFTQNLDLKPGKYQFRVVNVDVNKEVGFVIQKAKDAKGDVMKTAIPNSFTTALVKKGEAQYTGVIDLKAGEYVYSCPLNPTPHYKLTIK